jgi:hypothetical protein
MAPRTGATSRLSPGGSATHGFQSDFGRDDAVHQKILDNADFSP